MGIIKIYDREGEKAGEGGRGGGNSLAKEQKAGLMIT